MATKLETTSDTKVFENVVCPFCATLCDDLKVHVENNQVSKLVNACNLSKGVFLNAHKEWTTPRIDGKEVAYDDAVEKAATILAKANNPLIYGLAATDVDAQKKCIELADLIGANLDNASSV
jgi:formylmethanofuran dehydrogenase subunit B